MNLRDSWRFAWTAVAWQRRRSTLTVLGIVIGIASVILLTSLGEGTRRAIAGDFSQFGTNVMAIHRGKTTTTGVPGSVGGTTRKLTVEDSEALRRVPGVELVVPVAMGSARVEAGERERNVMIYGVTSDVPAVWKFRIGQGRFLPPADPRRAAPFAVLGPRVKRELFDEDNPLGEHVRIGGRRFLVIGTMAPKGLYLGFDMDDSAYIPVASAQRLFHSEELMEIDVLFSPGIPASGVKAGVREMLMRRHDGEEDFTVTSQTEALEILNRVMSVVTFAVGGIGAISLLVGSLGIVTMMWIAVDERTFEIGLLKSVGATSRQIAGVFLLEAAFLSATGGILGVAVGLALGAAFGAIWPSVAFRPTPAVVAGALLVSVGVGLASGVIPARRAASLDALEALRAE